MFTFAAFKSRKDALSYAEQMARVGIRVKVVSTPSKVGSSCGLSVKFQAFDGRRAQRVLSGGEYSTFLGFFEE